MSYLLTMSLDNPNRLNRKVHYFEYQGVRFKLVQNNPRKWSDTLLTIVRNGDRSPEAHAAYSAAGEFASALSWEFDAGVTIGGLGGGSFRSDLTLRNAKPRQFVFPRVPITRINQAVGGYSIERIARITDDHQRIALTLYREALSSNKDLLSLLLYWQILDVRSKDQVGWINKAVRKHPKELVQVIGYLPELPLAGRSLGNYLLDDCRDAIAHIRREPGRRPLKFDDDDESRRIWYSARVTKDLARFYIRTHLNVTDPLYLVRPRKGGFPTYLDEDTIGRGSFISVR
jgi:hypothetical protein